MRTFAEFLADQSEGLRMVKYKPNAKVPTKTFGLSGPEKMNPLGVVSPYRPRPYQSIFRSGKKPSMIANQG